MQAVLPHFRERGSGHIINVSSMLGRIPFAPFRSAYIAAKHALNGAHRLPAAWSCARAHPGITVSVVHPGVVATEFGVRSLHGGVDSRQIPGAQSVDEVGDVIAGVIEEPRADVYTRPERAPDGRRVLQRRRHGRVRGAVVLRAAPALASGESLTDSRWPLDAKP